MDHVRIVCDNSAALIQRTGKAMLAHTADIITFRMAEPSSDGIDAVPELPNPRQRWTVRRKASVVGADRGGWVPIEEICTLYNISVDEFLAWERHLDRYGVPGLRSMRNQIYRDTNKEARR